MMACFVRVFVRYVETNMVNAVYFHLIIDGSCHYIAGRQRQTIVILLHKTIAIGQPQHATVAPHGLGYEKSRMCLAQMKEGSGVELNELHVLYEIGRASCRERV